MTHPTTVEARDTNTWPYCARCGERFWLCKHLNTSRYDITDEEAERIRARYAFGKLHNPDHDITSYRDK